jgi:hypothetical protein
VPADPFAVPIARPVAAGAVEVLEVVDDDEDDAAGAAALALELELLELPHPASTIPEVASAATHAARNFDVVRHAIILLPVRGFGSTRRSWQVNCEDPGAGQILPDVVDCFGLLG